MIKYTLFIESVLCVKYSEQSITFMSNIQSNQLH